MHPRSPKNSRCFRCVKGEISLSVEQHVSINSCKEDSFDTPDRLFSLLQLDKSSFSRKTRFSIGVRFSIWALPPSPKVFRDNTPPKGEMST